MIAEARAELGAGLYVDSAEIGAWISHSDLSAGITCRLNKKYREQMFDGHVSRLRMVHDLL